MKRLSLILSFALLAPHASAGIVGGGSSGTSGGSGGQGGDKEIVETGKYLPEQRDLLLGVGDLYYSIPALTYDDLKQDLADGITQDMSLTIEGVYYDLVSESHNQLILRSADGHTIVMVRQTEDPIYRKNPQINDLRFELIPELMP